MRENKKNFPIGKLKHAFLAKMLNYFISDLDIQDERVILGEFVDIKKPTYEELLQKQFIKVQEKLTRG